VLVGVRARCPCRAQYCAVATHRAHIHPPAEIERCLDEALNATPRCYSSCERALERGVLPHTNIGVLERERLARLREIPASQGQMLEAISERLMETVHAGSPTKRPARRLATIEAADASTGPRWRT
jgi:FO synthase